MLPLEWGSGVLPLEGGLVCPSRNAGVGRVWCASPGVGVWCALPGKLVRGESGVLPLEWKAGVGRVWCASPGVGVWCALPGKLVSGESGVLPMEWGSGVPSQESWCGESLVCFPWSGGLVCPPRKAGVGRVWCASPGVGVWCALPGKLVWGESGVLPLEGGLCALPGKLVWGESGVLPLEWGSGVPSQENWCGESLVCPSRKAGAGRVWCASPGVESWCGESLPWRGWGVGVVWCALPRKAGRESLVCLPWREGSGVPSPGKLAGRVFPGVEYLVCPPL